MIQIKCKIYKSKRQGTTMKFLHISDLHLGRRLNEYNLIEDQKNVLKQAVQTVLDYKCDAVIIAGDIYDRPSPPAEAMKLFDTFISELCELGIKIYMISGNHDSAGRISYYSSIIRTAGVFTSEQFSGVIQTFDAGDNVTIHLLPFIKPINVRQFFPENEIHTYEEAVRAVIENSPLDRGRINILVCHQFIIGAQICESEELAVGGLDSISAEVFADFDYVALGHLHKAQRCGRETMRYSGSPLKYSVSEENHKKSFTVVDTKEKGNIVITEVPIKLPHDVRTVSGKFDDLIENNHTEDYVRIILTDEIVTPDARILLRSVFPNMLRFCVENSKTKYELDVSAEEYSADKTITELFSEFYAFQNNGIYPTEKQMKIVNDIFTEMEDETE